ncbi:MAG: hypothetical protein D3913_06340 [Candidatus Electrothrix sp. LOE1_4_5]|nr:hypothetical protein [Candidatus Electrothrix gigas]
MKKLSVLLLLCLSLFLTGCSSLNRNVSNLVFPPYSNSDQREGERVHLTFDYKEEVSREEIELTCKPEPSVRNDELPMRSFGPLSGVTATSALEFVTDQVQQFLKKEAELYTGSYSAVAAGDHFYTSCNAANNDIHLKGVTLTRSIKNAGKGAIKNDGKVMELSFDIEQTVDGTAFQIKPREITIAQSKAKITAFDITRPFGFDLLAPWTIFKINSVDELSPARPNEVDVTAEISVTAVWVDKSNKGHSELLASRKFNFGSIPLDGEPHSLALDGDELKVSPQLFPIIPRSNTLGDGKLGAGNFIISVLVTEYDDYAERIMELEQGVEKNKAGLIERLTDAL